MGILKTGKIQSHGGGDYESRIVALEGKYVKALWYAEISSGTSGTITPPANGTIVLNEWGNDVDAVTSTIVTGKKPDFVSAKTSAGAIVTATLAANGAWTISGAPSAYPIAIVYVYEIKLINFDRAYSLYEEEFGQSVNPTDSPVFADLTISGLSASKPVFSDSAKKLVSTGTLGVDQGGTGQITAPLAMNALGVPSATAESDFMASGATPFAWLKKTLTEVKTILGLGTAAYTAATSYVTHALATATNDFLVASGAGVFVAKTLAEAKVILNSILTQTSELVGFTIAGGTTSKTLTVDETVAMSDKLNVALTNKGCRVTHDVAQTISNLTDTVLAFNAEIFDTDVMHDTGTNNSRVTCKTAGTYLITAQVSFAYNPTGRRAGIIRLGGSTFLAVQQFPAVSTGGERTDMTISTIYQLAVNDYFEVVVAHDSGGNLDVLNNAWGPVLSAMRIA